MAELSDYLKGEKPPQLETPQVETPQQEAPAETPEPAKADRQRDESGRFVKGETEAKVEAEKPATPKEAAPPAAKVEAKPPAVTGLEAGIAAERQKRQAAEQRALELEARFKAMEAKLNPPPPPPDPVANPQGFTQSIEQRFQQMQIDHHVNTSVAVARVRHQDFDEVMQAFGQMPQPEGQALYFQAIQSQDPAGFVYQALKRQQFLAEVGDDPSAYRQKIEAELREKLEAEYSQRTPPPVVNAPPPSLANARSNGRMSEAVWSGPPPLSSAFKR